MSTAMGTATRMNMNMDMDMNDPSRHGRVYASNFVFEAPVDPRRSTSAEAIMRLRGADLLRVKGIVNVLAWSSRW